MHPALRIDEVLRQIFFYAADSKKDLTSLAQVCRSWKEPALDFTWKFLPSLSPLLNLLNLVPVLTKKNAPTRMPSSDIDTLSFYAVRVRQLVHRQICVPSSDQTQALLHILEHKAAMLPMLVSLDLSFRAWISLYHILAFSKNLQRLDLDLGFGSRAENHIGESHQFLVNVAMYANNLHELCIRGTLSHQFHELVPLMRNLQRISLRTGTSLTTAAILELARLPSLIELEFHATHLTAESIASELGEMLFPSLQNMRLHAQSSAITAIIAALPHNKLNRLWLEAQDAVHTDVDWNDILKLVSTKIPTSLNFIGLEHHVELMQDETIIDNPTINSVSQLSPTIVTAPSVSISGHRPAPSPSLSLRSFSKFHALKKVQVEMTIPPSFSKEDVQELCMGCPALEHLDLGGSSCFEPKMAAELADSNLRCFQSLQQLESLALPGIHTVNQIPSTSEERSGVPSKLRSLILTQTSFVDGSSLARHLMTFFPGLESVDGSPTQDNLWSAARAELSHFRRQAC
ncbi:hypothetical protein D9756_002322 [Leucocoprinus leucothites]|uniref:F-box domain-containing protein n=1 Tax=Leucocoprinus leucothites TaxID=201217 RepID=A0A8H5LLT0_9AGAR|nr:hypothetical protein D9756_002322 [Leucoagaricus leucothites]